MSRVGQVDLVKVVHVIYNWLSELFNGSDRGFIYQLSFPGSMAEVSIRRWIDGHFVDPVLDREVGSRSSFGWLKDYS